jgi:hypothetical protein
MLWPHSLNTSAAPTGPRLACRGRVGERNSIQQSARLIDGPLCGLSARLQAGWAADPRRWRCITIDALRSLEWRWCLPLLCLRKRLRQGAGLRRCSCSLPGLSPGRHCRRSGFLCRLRRHVDNVRANACWSLALHDSKLVMRRRTYIQSHQCLVLGYTESSGEKSSHSKRGMGTV